MSDVQQDDTKPAVSNDPSVPENMSPKPAPIDSADTVDGGNGLPATGGEVFDTRDFGTFELNSESKSS